MGPREDIDQLVHLAPLLTAVAAGNRMLDAVADVILSGGGPEVRLRPTAPVPRAAADRS